jgi:hypothetical protein
MRNQGEFRRPFVLLFFAFDICLNFALPECLELFALLLAAKNFRFSFLASIVNFRNAHLQILLIVMLQGTRPEFVSLATPSKMCLSAAHSAFMRSG